MNQRRDHYRVAKLPTIVNLTITVASAGGSLRGAAPSLAEGSPPEVH